MTYMSKFVTAYVECALWSSTDESGQPLDTEYSEDDIAPGAIRAMRRECADFVWTNRRNLQKSCLDPAQAGHDFWLTRNGHGAGFWDRGIGTIGQELTKAAKAYGSCDLCVGDDGRIYA